VLNSYLKVRIEATPGINNNNNLNTMKIRFRKDTNIRKDHTSLKTKPIGEVFANTELEVEETLHEGADLKGKKHWWRDQNGWYYWAGATETPNPARWNARQYYHPASSRCGIGGTSYTR
jgi:hypothetical protein